MDDVVMVTGGLGMVGSHVCRALVAAGRRPLVYDAGGDTALIADVVSRCDLVQGGIGDLPRLMGAVREHRPGAILHFAAQVGAQVERFPWAALQTNLLGTSTVLECARLTGIRRVLFASSKMVYGPVAQRHRHPTYQPVSEDHPREPADLYGKLKRATEEVADHYAQLYGLDVLAFRFGASFGPGAPGRHKVPVVAMIEAAIARQPFHFEQGAEQFDDLCYAGEAAHATMAALESPPRYGRLRVYNISSGELVSLAQMIAVLQEFHPGWQGSAGPGLDYRKTGPGYYFRMDIAKAQEELGFTPKFNFASAVRDHAAVVGLGGL